MKYQKNQSQYLILILVLLIVMAALPGCSNRAYNNGESKNVSNLEYEVIVKLNDNGSIGDIEKNQELWVKYPDGKEEKLVSYKYYEDVKKITQGINGIFYPQLSYDKTKIYFLTRTWVTSDSVHVVDIKTKKERYICPGNSLEVLQSGTYKGKFIVNQHRYHDGGGSYDHYFLVDEDGKVIKEFGEDIDENEREQLQSK